MLASLCLLGEFCVLALLAIGQTAVAQKTRGTIFGTVRDSSGAVLPGMMVLVTNEDTNVSSEAVTNSSGVYEIPYLAAVPGEIHVLGRAASRGGRMARSASAPYHCYLS